MSWSAKYLIYTFLFYTFLNHCQELSPLFKVNNSMNPLIHRYPKYKVTCISAYSEATIYGNSHQNTPYPLGFSELFQNTQCRLTSFHCALVYCTLHVLHFFIHLDLWQPCIKQVYHSYFSYSICSLHVLVIF